MPKSEATTGKEMVAPKRPVAMEPLRFGIDIDGTITRAPLHFKRLIESLIKHGDEVYIITGREEDIRQETEELLERLGIRYTELIMRHRGWQGTVADFKVREVKRKRIHLMIDDNAETCWAIQQRTPSLAAHMLPIPEMPEARAAKARLHRASNNALHHGMP